MGCCDLNIDQSGGEELLFAVDTGMPVTILDNSLEPRLGKRLATVKSHYTFLQNVAVGLYKTPKLYLGDAPLITGNLIGTDDMKRFAPGRPVMGILGSAGASSRAVGQGKESVPITGRVARCLGSCRGAARCQVG